LSLRKRVTSQSHFYQFYGDKSNKMSQSNRLLCFYLPLSLSSRLTVSGL